MIWDDGMTDIHSFEELDLILGDHVLFLISLSDGFITLLNYQHSEYF